MHLLGAKAAAPINAFANKMGSQAFLPSTMDKECEKAAAILTSFCSKLCAGLFIYLSSFLLQAESF